ncbi:hypothetical protein ACHRV6_13780 [Flavobacterium sp. FlaQc-51]|jgi:hypothetical protein|uniref:hypothetical protein n=1 Tax=unclassified Flavobacterium TaxID=196869 RepID=UPI000ABEC014|nr:hypothetical protein [Flavobacterium sp. Leaf82]
MKIKTIFFALFLTLISMSVFAAEPPVPMKPMGVPVNPPTSDINQDILLLLMSALLLGMYTVYNHNLKRKASI